MKFAQLVKQAGFENWTGSELRYTLLWYVEQKKNIQY